MQGRAGGANGSLILCTDGRSHVPLIVTSQEQQYLSLFHAKVAEVREATTPAARAVSLVGSRESDAIADARCGQLPNTSWLPRGRRAYLFSKGSNCNVRLP